MTEWDRVANAICQCGGKGPNDPGVCPACRMYHRIAEAGAQVVAAACDFVHAVDKCEPPVVPSPELWPKLTKAVAALDAAAEPERCKGCAADISTGYSWEGLCVVCAEPHTNPHYEPDGGREDDG